ncbi:MAG: recombinase family protein [Polyangiaceae bacterium]
MEREWLVFEDYLHGARPRCEGTLPDNPPSPRCSVYVRLPFVNKATEEVLELMTRVVGYARVSTEGQADGGVSLDAQRAKLAAYATAMDLELVAVEVDAGVSAKTLDRPALQRALAMLDAGQAEGLLVAKLDRLTRSVRDLGDLVERYFAARFSLMSVADSIDTRSAAGRLVLNVLASVAQWEREATAERTRDALAHLQAEGVLIGGVPLGLRRTDEVGRDGRRVVVEHDGEAAAVRRMLEMRAGGISLRSIARVLREEGHATKRGGRWVAATVGRVLARAAA